MNSAARLLPVLALLPLALACAMPLPAPQLTATAESLPQATPPPLVSRAGGDVQAASSGAPNAAPLSLQQAAAEEGDAPSALAPLEDAELTAAADATATPQPDGDTEPAPTPEPPPDTSTYPGDMFALLNQYREERGVPALQPDAALTAAAMDYARHMATTGFFGHYPPDGSTPAGRVAAAGFAGRYQGEALSAGQATPAIALSRLLGSADHASILLNSSSVAVGVGHYYQPGSAYGHYWVIVTANP